MLLMTIISLVASLGAALAAMASLLALKRTRHLISYLDQAISTLRDETLPIMRDTKGNASAAQLNLEKIETLIDSATLANNLIGKTSRLALAAVTSPMVEAKSLSAGIRHAVLVFKSKKQR